MKPERLQMEGFAPFRTATTVDFAGVELFALTGPTGAGKSSVIDAITFALYGSVPRYGRGSVEPVVSLGASEARIRFDFTVEEQPYTAVRVVRRSNRGGANTSEARLESRGENLASGAAELTAAVESLLGLDIGQFTRSVVLPQGEFAAFLHDTPAGQQDLVKALLDLGILDQVRTGANERARTNSALAGANRSRLDSLADAGEEAEKGAASRLDMLEGLRGAVDAAEKTILETKEVVRVKRELAAKLKDEVDLLSSVKLPGGVEALATDLAGATAEVQAATEAMATSSADLDRARLESDQVPSSERLKAATDLDARLDAARHRLAAIDVDSLEAAVEQAINRAEAAAVARLDAARQHEEARSRHAAHALVAGLATGDPCPVCHRPLVDAPAEAPPDLARSSELLAQSEAQLAEHNHALVEARTHMTRAQATHEAELRAVAELEQQRGEFPAASELDVMWAARRASDERLASAQDAFEKARDRSQAAVARLTRLEATEKSAWETFRTIRDRVARLDPPPDDQADLAAAWSGLVTWASTESDKLRQARDAANTEVETTMKALSSAEAEVDQLLAGAAVEGTAPPSARLAGAVATAEANLVQARARRAEREALEADLLRFEDGAQLARALATHMRANNFEGWLLAEALATLVAGANGLLAELSRGNYSLALRSGKIEVIDHRNADERRSVRSLSGGETFLVSLALALSLGEHIVTLSERGGARLDALFLDEGFGSLDDETLDTVTAVVTELASQGRVVGLVTHVKELAEQVPVRFTVTPGPGGSTIERLGAE